MDPHIFNKIKVMPAEECEKAAFVLCLESKPENECCRSKGSIDVACDGCGTMVMLSKSSPIKPPKLCFKCALARMENHQSLSE